LGVSHKVHHASPHQGIAAIALLKSTGALWQQSIKAGAPESEQTTKLPV
jgi:hypothetical protein